MEWTLKLDVVEARHGGVPRWRLRDSLGTLIHSWPQVEGATAPPFEWVLSRALHRFELATASAGVVRLDPGVSRGRSWVIHPA